ncbi:hypothetical protein ACTQ2S_04885 [Parolsenella catena]|uniref:hypothetical protein n=1 Tax=Parolsenella catena TaxID=2003188 RepID=UPI003F9CF0C6
MFWDTALVALEAVPATRAPCLSASDCVFASASFAAEMQESGEDPAAVKLTVLDVVVVLALTATPSPETSVALELAMPPTEATVPCEITRDELAEYLGETKPKAATAPPAISAHEIAAMTIRFT